jgi:DNA-binding transcriptional regulator YiaG
MTEEVTKLINLRKKFRLPRDYIAYRLGCAEYTLIRWEQGISKPSPIYRRQLKRLISRFPGGNKNER